MATALRTVWLRGLVALLSSGLILASAAAEDHQRAPIPGAVDSHVTQATIHDTICEPGYSAKVRPPRKFTDSIKRRSGRGFGRAVTSRVASTRFAPKFYLASLFLRERGSRTMRTLSKMSFNSPHSAWHKRSKRSPPLNLNLRLAREQDFPFVLMGRF